MKYEVRKDGKVYMTTIHKEVAYSADIERSMRKAGYEIFVDGKKKRRLG